jgi:hypothetical protein
MVKIPLFPSYIQTQLLIKYLSENNESEYKSIWNVIWNLRGTPQEPVNRQNPEQWIPERLSGTDRDFALMIWKETDHQVNPRYVRGIQFLIDGYDLLIPEKDLLDAMGYEDVVVTSPTNDKGVDVVGNIPIGITIFREIIQVKKLFSGNLQKIKSISSK